MVTGYKPSNADNLNNVQYVVDKAGTKKREYPKAKIEELETVR